MVGMSEVCKKGFPSIEPFDAVVYLLNVLVILGVRAARRDAVLALHIGGIDSYLERKGKRLG